MTMHDQRQMTDSRVAIASGPLDVAGALDARERRQQLLEHDADLEPGEVRAEAVVQAVSEPDVRVRVPAEFEQHRVLEDRLVAIRGSLPDQDLVPRLDHDVTQLGRTRGRPALRR